MIFAALRLPQPNKKANFASSLKKYQWHSTSWLPEAVERRFLKLAKIRWKFCTCAPYAGSNIDVNIRFHKMIDILGYVPRAFEVGFFAPFPDFWFKPAKKSGRISRLIVGAEMIFIYLIYFGMHS